MFVPYFFCRSGNGNYQVFLDGAESGSFSADGLFNRHDAGLLRLRFTQLDICSAAQSVRYADVRFRLSNAKMMLRLIFIIGCVWNSTPKYTPNYWDSKRHLETFSFTLCCNLHLIISCLRFYEILWKYKFESLSLRWTNWTKPDSKQTSPTNSMICGTFFYPLVSALKYIFSPLKDKVRNLTRTPDKQNR